MPETQPQPGTHPEPWQNSLTYGGLIVAAVSLVLILSFLWFDWLAETPSPYLGLVTFLILPGFMAIGCAAAVIGILFTRRRLRKQGVPLRFRDYYPHLDLNLPKHRRVVGFMAAGVALALPFMGLMSYEGYHYTDSNAFCGRICHQVMEPEYSAYLNSPHARVNCVDCHIGTGATWYVKSKFSGIRQVFAVMLDTYPRPIPPAIKELRPARETCEQCHWPAKFFGDQLLPINHFAQDEGNTLHTIRLLVKTGGGDPSSGPPSGIHWHMALEHTIEYVATDNDLQEIPWTRITDHKSGESRVYRSDGKPVSAPPPDGTRRAVDCMDCHNRPTHIYRTPDRAGDVALNVDVSLQALPFAKRQFVAAVTAGHANKEEGLSRVPEVIRTFYRDSYPKVWSEKGDTVERLAEAARKYYDTYVFPAMQVNWRTYPDNIGHLFFPGCFRCHAGKHVNGEGQAISHDCTVCHEFLVPGESTDGSATVRSGDFVHSVPLEGIHATMRCDRCHTGGLAPARTCEGCHTEQAAFIRGTTEVFQSFEIKADSMADVAGCTDCHDLSKPRTAIATACVDCHGDDEFAQVVDGWKQEMEEAMTRAEASAGANDQPILEALRRANPLHNMAASRKILESLAGASDQD